MEPARAGCQTEARLEALLTLVCHAATAATRRAAFPRDEPLDAQGRARAAAAARPRRVDAAWCGPSLRTRETAALLGLDAAVEPALRDLDPGPWAGRTLEEVGAEDPAGVSAWLAGGAPPGGEALGALLARVSAWLGAVRGREGRMVAVTHAAVARAAVVAALGAPEGAFWRVEVGPLGRVRLRGGPGGWRVVGIGGWDRPGGGGVVAGPPGALPLDPAGA